MVCFILIINDQASISLGQLLILGLGPAMDGNIPTPKESSEWLNLNSFTARIINEGLIDGSIFGLWEIRRPLEEENAAKAIANCRVSVASEWMIRSGTQLYSKVLNAGPLDERQARINGWIPVRW